jgi:hypothetical protein
MLDLASLKQQINRMTSDRKKQRKDFSERVGRAFEELARWKEDWRTLSDKVARSRTSWLVATISEPLRASYAPPERPKQLTVVASDGSQIYPDRHEISPCYLVNIGRIAFHYGTLGKPTMSSQPKLFYEEEDLHPMWGGRRGSANTEIVSAQRAAMELEALAQLAQEAREDGKTTVALSDGTLIFWTLEGKPADFRDAALKNSLALFERFREQGTPLAGYISQPGSRDVVNALQVGLCPLDAADCDRCPFSEKGDELFPPDSTGASAAELPCAAIEGVTDRMLFVRLLKPGERSGVFGSSSKILKDYGPHRTRFFYVNVGYETARVEIPAWVAEDEALLGLVHTCVVDQAEKGDGYPIALAEAHERAVVRGPDRELFYKLLEDTFVRNEIQARVSRKSFRKRAISI